MGHSEDTMGHSEGYSEGSVGVKWDTVRVQGIYSGVTVRVQWGTVEYTVRVHWGTVRIQ